MDIPQELKDKVIRITKSNKMSVKAILRYISKEYDLTIEDYYKILSEYENESGIKITRGMDRRHLTQDEEEELLIQLCAKGYSNEKIKSYFIEHGYSFTIKDIEEKISTIYKEKGYKRRYKKSQKRYHKVEEQEVLELRKQGKTFEQMRDYFKKKGIIITHQRLQQIVDDYYDRIGENKPPRVLVEPNSGKVLFKKKLGEEQFEIIYKMRIEEMSYEDISLHFINKGFIASPATISKICKTIFAQKKEKEPVIRKKKFKIPVEQIVALKEQGMSIQDAVAYYKSIGVKVTERYIKEKYAFIERKEKKSISRRQKSIELMKQVTYEELRSLKLKGMTYRQIQQYYIEKGIVASMSYYKKRWQKRNKGIKIDIRTIPEEKLNAVLFNMKQTKGATDEQLEKIAEIYGFNYISNEKISPLIIHNPEER